MTQYIIVIKAEKNISDLADQFTYNINDVNKDNTIDVNTDKNTNTIDVNKDHLHDNLSIDKSINKNQNTDQTKNSKEKSSIFIFKNTSIIINVVGIIYVVIDYFKKSEIDKKSILKSKKSEIKSYVDEFKDIMKDITQYLHLCNLENNFLKYIDNIKKNTENLSKKLNSSKPTLQKDFTKNIDDIKEDISKLQKKDEFNKLQQTIKKLNDNINTDICNIEENINEYIENIQQYEYNQFKININLTDYNLIKEDINEYIECIKNINIYDDHQSMITYIKQIYNKHYNQNNQIIVELIDNFCHKPEIQNKIKKAIQRLDNKKNSYSMKVYYKLLIDKLDEHIKKLDKNHDDSDDIYD